MHSVTIIQQLIHLFLITMEWDTPRCDRLSTMEDVLRHLEGLQEAGELSQEILVILQKCISLIITYRGPDNSEQLATFLEGLLLSVIKPLFIGTAPSSAHKARFSDHAEKPWKHSAPWSVDVLRWILDQYGTLEVSLQKQAIEYQFPLLVPPILSLLDDGDTAPKRAGCDLLRVLCFHLVNCESRILKRTALTKAFEESLAHNMLLLPSLTPEEESLQILSSLYSAYRALVAASFLTSPSLIASNTGKLTAAPKDRDLVSRELLDQHALRQAMLDRMLRNGILAGYMHASDRVQIATLLVSEMSYVVTLMGASSAKYLSTLLPLLRSILTNPLGTAYLPLLESAVLALRELILQCWPRIAEMWWEECLRSVVGLWLLLSDEEGSMVQQLKNSAKGLVDILLQVKTKSEMGEELDLLYEGYEQLEGLVPVGKWQR
jgi:tRNA nucleotidyltransferase (CCA-adding enzyme)